MFVVVFVIVGVFEEEGVGVIVGEFEGVGVIVIVQVIVAVSVSTGVLVIVSVAVLVGTNVSVSVEVGVWAWRSPTGTTHKNRLNKKRTFISLKPNLSNQICQKNRFYDFFNEQWPNIPLRHLVYHLKQKSGSIPLIFAVFSGMGSFFTQYLVWIRFQNRFSSITFGNLFHSFPQKRNIRNLQILKGPGRAGST